MTIAGIMVNPEEKTSDRLAAAKELLNRAHGKSPQVVSFDDGKDTRVKLFADIVGAISDMRDVTAPVEIGRNVCDSDNCAARSGNLANP